VWRAADDAPGAPAAHLARQGAVATALHVDDPELVRVRGLLADLRPDAADPWAPMAAPVETTPVGAMPRDPSASWGGLPRGLLGGDAAREAAQQRCAAEVLAEAARGGDEFRVPSIAQPKASADGGDAGLDLADIRNSLRSLMWRHVGVERSGDSLAEALATVEGWCRYVLPQQFADPQGWQLQNMLEVARLMIRGAIRRDETRGVHGRADHPETRDAWQVHIAWRRGDAEPRLEPRP
jgi:succinate dehydrogenase/fumarate reductase flavoprotein subunit